jgi:monomeric sarcosine oxidase
MSTTRRTAAKLLAAAAMSPLAARGAGASDGRLTADVGIIGAGAFGAWTAYALRALGLSVCLVDAYGPANSRASSGGESRIIRTSYGDREIYSRWAQESLPAWKALAERSGAPLFEPTGVLAIARERDAYLAQSHAVLGALGIRHERLNAAETMRRFPQFHLDADESAIFEPDSGALYARHAIQTLVQELVAGGTVLRIGAVHAPTGGGRLASLGTGSGVRLSAEQYVFACGPWLPKLFPALLKDRIRADRAEVFFLGVPSGDPRFLPSAMPTWMDRYGPDGAYGFPSLEGRGCKVAVDSIVQPIDPDDGDRMVTAAYVSVMREFVRFRLPALADAPIVETRVCQYEMTTDEHYLLDRHPDYDNVWIAGGGSGHGFKTGPMVGRYLAQQLTRAVPPNPLFALRKTHN